MKELKMVKSHRGVPKGADKNELNLLALLLDCVLYFLYKK